MENCVILVLYILICTALYEGICCENQYEDRHLTLDFIHNAQ